MPPTKKAFKPNPALKPIGTRFTIGMVVDWIDDQYQLDLLYGIIDLAKEKDVNLLCFEGGVIHPQNEFEAIRNKVYDLITPENVDGLIILSSIIGPLLDSKSFIQFYKNYRPLPVVLIGLTIPQASSLLVDNSGLRSLMLHLINVHQYKRFAFIKGIESRLDARERYDIFEQTLAEYQIPVDQQLVVQGDFSFNSGVEAIRTLLDQRQAVFDVVVACNDDMAAGAINELKAREIKVPEEIAVTGFDNLTIGRMISPPLTTVGYSIYELGWRAAEILVDQLEHKSGPISETISTRLIIRNSCGCTNHQSNCFREEIRPEIKNSIPANRSTWQTDKSKLISTVVENTKDLFFDTKRINVIAIINKLFAAFEAEFGGKEGAFFKAWDEILDIHLRIHGDMWPWQTLISELRNHLIPYFIEREVLFKAEELFQQIRLLISEKAFKLELSIHNETIQTNSALSFLREHLLAAVDENKSMDLLAHTLPGLGIKSCYITMFEGKMQQKSRLILAYDENGRIDNQGGKRFFPNKLLPANIFTQKRRFTMLVVALNSIKPRLGYALFEMNLHDGRVYSELRRIICGTIQVATFFSKIQEQANRLNAQKESISKNIHQLRRVMTGFIQAIALTVESRDPYTAGHQHRVADLACAIATEMKLTPDQVECIQMAGIIHDLGKIYIPAEILNKPGRLSELEFTFIKNHPEVAYDIIEKIEFPWPIAQIILQHHERMDGSGYPFGLKGQDIKLEARILIVADVVEAMISHRPYRTAFSLEKALMEIEEKRGLLYDSDVVEICLELFRAKGFQFKN
jgi:HD-GYP domain-containing protein (c-di-GMP phosphodiesterase class II)/DNA-binding LacI/PurR family transcriptional regulator